VACKSGLISFDWWLRVNYCGLILFYSSHSQQLLPLGVSLPQPSPHPTKKTLMNIAMLKPSQLISLIYPQMELALLFIRDALISFPMF